MLDFQNAEQILLDSVRSLSPARVSQVIDFARWLQTQPTLEEPAIDEISDAELEAEEEVWQSHYLEHQESFREMARSALKEHESGETREMAFAKGEIHPK